MRRALLALFLLSCNDGPSAVTVDVQVVTATGGDPLAAAAFETLTVEVAQDDRPITRISERAGGTFDLPIAIDSLTNSTRVRVRLEGAVPYVGAPPRFVPVATGGLVRVIMGPAGTCEVVPEADLGDAREQWATTRVGGDFAIFAAGVDEDGPSTAVAFLDLVRFFGGDLDDLAMASGRGRATFVGPTRAVVTTEGGTSLYDLANAEERNRGLAVHAGAGLRSAVASVSTRALIAGGDLAGEPVDGITWLLEDGAVADTEGMTLQTPRRDAAAAFLGQLAIVAGGSQDGLVAELLNLNTETSTPIPFDDGVREGAVLARDGEALLLLGGTNESGELRTDTVSIL
ncbi:MAG: hypothetical protein AAGE52_33755, partial [Myxococcota bacterium]